MDLGPENPIAFGIVMFGLYLMAFYGFGLALMYALSWMGDRIRRPVIAYGLTTAGAMAWVAPSRQWWIVAIVALTGAACMAVHVFAVIGRRIPDVEPPPRADDDWEEDDGGPDSR